MMIDDNDLEDPSNQLIEKLGHHQSLTICSHIDLQDDDDDSYHLGSVLFLWTMFKTHPTHGLLYGVCVMRLVMIFT